MSKRTGLLQILRRGQSAMKRTAIAAILLGLAAAPVLTAKPASIKGTYVEARTAEVFAGGCVMNGEAGTTGREALLAWKVDQGRFDGVPLTGLSVVAAVSADVNLGIHEIGGESPTTRAALFVDNRATPAQQKALVAMAKQLSNGIVSSVVQVTPTAIQFVDDEHDIRVAAQPLRRADGREPAQLGGDLEQVFELSALRGMLL
jgi:hypothetical protein